MQLAEIIFYGVLCGTLAAMAPSLGKNMWFRVVVGVAVGVGSVFVLPHFAALLS